MEAIDLTILGAFILYAIVSGLRSSAIASKGLNEYFLAGKQLKGWQAGMSMAATQFAADTPLLYTGLIASAGIFSLWRMWIYALSFLMIGFLIGPAWRRSGVLTDAEFTERRYSGKPAAFLRAVKALYTGTLLNCVGLAIVLLAATRIAEPFLTWNQWLPAAVFAPVETLMMHVGVPFTVNAQSPDVWILSANNMISIIVIALTTLFYSATGGLRSVVATDVLQLILALTGSFLYAMFAVDAAGGFAEINKHLAATFAMPNPLGMDPSQLLAFTPDQAKDASLLLLTVFGIQWLAQMGSDGSGYMAQRMLACKTDNDTKQAVIVFTVTQVILRSLIWIPIALALLVLFPPDLGMSQDSYRAAREFTFVRGIAETLPAGLRGLMMVGMLAALASTVDTHLNWGASYWTNDLYKRFFCRSVLKREPSDRSLVWVARFSNVCILIIALVIMARLSSIQQAWQDSLLLGAGIGIALVMRWVWWRVNVWGEIACLLASFIVIPILLYATPPQYEGLRVLILFCISIVICVAASLATPAEPMDRLKQFYDSARPPGFWSPVAVAAGLPAYASERVFFRAGAATVIAALSVFCLLTGLGTWFYNSPAPVFFPWREVWVGLLLLLGFGLVPVWMRLAFHRETSESSSLVEDQSVLSKSGEIP